MTSSRRPSAAAIAAIFFLAACVQHDPAGSPGPMPTTEPRIPDSTVASALDTLLTAEQMGSQAVGFAGVPSEGAKAFAILWNAPDPKHHFASLAASDLAIARLHALLALRRLDPPSATALAEGLTNDVTKIQTIRGCVVIVRPVKEVADQIVAGRWDGLIAFAEGR